MSSPRGHVPTMPALLAEVRAKPGMYIGGKTIRGLEMLLSGMGLAEWFHAVAADREVGGLDRQAFEAWMAAQHNRRQLSVNSFWLAEHIAGSDADWFDLWFWWYDAFNAAADRR